MSKYAVAYPTRPSSVYTQWVEADSPTGAVQAAAKLDWPTAPGYTVAFDKEPEVWINRRPYRIRSKRVSGPDYGG
ncbi:hypothetical protein [Streptomyces sp. NPDC058653]|uniref:hypothetical protein n=1 Tax=Streptomyces sp. NPDC058653 TaxID=3346576 RepID=UPI003652AF18